MELKAKYRITDGRHIAGRKNQAGAGPRRKAAKGGNNSPARHTWKDDPTCAKVYANEKRTQHERANPGTLVLRDGKARIVHGPR